MRVQPDELSRRLESMPGEAPAWSFDPRGFDAQDALQVDEVAGHLLQRFFGQDDGRAFELLVDVTTPLLMRTARGLVRELGLAVDAEQFVTQHLTGIFTDLRERRPGEDRFLAAAERAMRAEARHLLESARVETPVYPLLPCVEAAAAGQPDAPRLMHFGSAFLGLIQSSFHALGESDRRLLLAREVERLTYDQIAERLSLPVNEVGPMLRDARARFSKRIAAAFLAGGSEAERQP